MTSYPDSSFTSRTIATLGLKPISAQPPGRLQVPSLRSLTSNNRLSENTAARIPTFGVACPMSFLNRSTNSVEDISLELVAIISAAICCTLLYAKDQYDIERY